MEQTIYVDVLLAVNLFVNYFLLLTVKNFFHLKTSRLRFVLGAAIGALASLIILLPQMNELISAVLNLFIAVTIIFASFYPIEKNVFIKITAAFYIFNFSFAGVMLFVWYFISPEVLFIRNNIVYFRLSPLFLCGLTVITYFTVTLINKFIGKREADELFCKVEVFLGKTKIEVLGKIDTGNSLREPFSQYPVIIIAKPIVKGLEEQFRVIPFSDVSGGGILKAFRTDKVILKRKGKTIENTKCYAAFFEKGFGGDFEALINPEIISEGVRFDEKII